MDEFGISFGLSLLGIFLIGMIIGSNLQNSPQTTTTYTLEDGTVLYDCDDLKEDCGLHISCNSGTTYLCQKNVKITTETKDKCGG